MGEKTVNQRTNKKGKTLTGFLVVSTNCIEYVTPDPDQTAPAIERLRQKLTGEGYVCFVNGRGQLRIGGYSPSVRYR